MGHASAPSPLSSLLSPLSCLLSPFSPLPNGSQRSEKGIVSAPGDRGRGSSISPTACRKSCVNFYETPDWGTFLSGKWDGEFYGFLGLMRGLQSLWVAFVTRKLALLLNETKHKGGRQEDERFSAKEMEEARGVAERFYGCSPTEEGGQCERETWMLVCGRVENNRSRVPKLIG